jgi:hypothetical protein
MSATKFPQAADANVQVMVPSELQIGLVNRERGGGSDFQERFVTEIKFTRSEK